MINFRALLGKPRYAAPDGPQVVDGGEVRPLQPWRTPDEGVREVRHYQVQLGKRERKEKTERDRLSGGLLSTAGLIIAASLVGAGYVGYEAQRLFALQHLTGSDREVRASIVAALPDAGWVAMAIVALVAALRGRSSVRARIGVLIFFGLSLGAQLMYAPETKEGWLVAVIAPITLAWMLESFIVEVRRWAGSRRKLKIDESPVLTVLGRIGGRVLLGTVRLPMWVIRLGFDRRGTWAGVREWVLDEAPLAPGRTRASLRAAAAIEQAGSTEQAAARAAEQARAEAQAEIAQAQAEVDRIQAWAAEQVEAVQHDTERRLAAAQADAARRIETTQQSTAADLNAAEADRVRLIEQVRQECQREVRKHQAAAEDLRQTAQAQLNRLQEENGQLAGELDRLRGEYDRVIGAASAKTKLIAAYERLGNSGDTRYMERERVSEVARELYRKADLRSEGTARQYLYEHIDATRQGVPA